MRQKSKLMKRFAALTLSAALTALPVTALAASPEFSRTAEEWATLQDNVLEYGEIEDLVHEYNATVQKNDLELNKFRQDYGMRNDEWSRRYRELADDLESGLDYPSVDDSSYATVMSSIVTSEMQIETWRETADDALEDYEIYYLNYEAEEKQIAQTAQNDLIQYFQNQVTLQSDLLSRQYLEATYQNTVTKQALGSATGTEVLLAEEDLQLNQESIEQDQSSIERTRENLLVLLGWSHDADPVIEPLPAIDFERIALINPDADLPLALENNYTLRVNQRKYQNAEAADTKESLEKTITENEQMIGASLNAAYRAVLSAQVAYELAQSESELEQIRMGSAERQYALGNISRMDYVAQQNSANTKQVAVWTAYLNLFQALQDYDWAVKGLAST